MIFLRSVNYTILAVYLLMFTLLLMANCGGGGSSFAVPPPEVFSPEYQAWRDRIKNMTPEEFSTWWNEEELKNWQFGTYEGIQDIVPGTVVLPSPDTASLQEVFDSKVYNCNRITKQLVSIRGGLFVYIDQPGEANHAVYCELFEGSWKMLSIGGFCSYYDLGYFSLDKNTLKEKLIDLKFSVDDVIIYYEE